MPLPERGGRRRFAHIRAVVFDVYATLFHNEQTLWQQTFVQIVREQQLPIEPIDLYTKWRAHERGFRRRRVNLQTLQQVQPFETYEQAWRECFTKVFAETGLPGDAQRAVARCLEGQATRELFPDTLPLLNALQGRYKLGAVSNADAGYLESLLKRGGLRGRLDAVLSSEEAREYKPCPGPFREALRRLGVAAHEALYIGDTPLDDVLGPKNVGMHAAWLNRDGAAPEPGLPQPDAVITSLAQVPSLLKDGALS